MLTSKKQVLHSAYWDSYMKDYLIANNQEQMAHQISFEYGSKEKFWVPCIYQNPETNVVEQRGAILISVHLLLQEQADKYD